MKSKILAVIPARYESSRFPGKPLAEIKGKSILQRLYAEISCSKLIDKVVVATDSDKIREAVAAFGGVAIRTSKKHRTGSDRSAEVLSKTGASIVINIQADQLGLKATDYDRVLTAMNNDSSIKYATFAKKVESETDLFDPNRVKVIFDSDNNALWFSRFPLPYLQNSGGNKLDSFDFYYHIGVYFYRNKALEDFASWPRSKYEKAESLEQLRVLEHGQAMKIFKINRNMLSIDTPEDLKKAANSVK